MGEFDSLLRVPPTSKTFHKYVAILLAKRKIEQVVVETLPSLNKLFSDMNVYLTHVDKIATFDDLFALKLSLAVEPEVKVREKILEEIKGKEIDLVLFDEQEYNSRSIKLAAFDMDSCILGHECIDELGSEMGVSERVKDITHRAMAGELDFNEALRERVGLLAGMKETQLETVWLRLHLNPGAVSLISALKASGVKVALVSGGFTYFAHRVATRLGIDYAFSNTLEIDENGLLTGRVVGDIVNGNMKESIVRTLAEKLNISMSNVITMGDGANDQYMVRAAGIGIAYHAKAVLKSSTPHHIDFTPLNSLLIFANINNNIIIPDNIIHSQNDVKERLESLPVHSGFPSFTSIVDLFNNDATISL